MRRLPERWNGPHDSKCDSRQRKLPRTITDETITDETITDDSCRRLLLHAFPEIEGGRQLAESWPHSSGGRGGPYRGLGSGVFFSDGVSLASSSLAAARTRGDSSSSS